MQGRGAKKRDAGGGGAGMSYVHLPKAGAESDGGINVWEPSGETGSESSSGSVTAKWGLFPYCCREGVLTPLTG